MSYINLFTKKKKNYDDKYFNNIFFYSLMLYRYKIFLKKHHIS